MKRFTTMILIVLTTMAGTRAQISQNHNYVITRTPLDATSDAASSGRVLTHIQYYDGLGRPDLLVEKGVTPSGGDLLHKTGYDALGRAYRRWLPMPISDRDGAYVSSSDVEVAGSNFHRDGYLYTETLYEASPLNRVTGRRTPGSLFYDYPSGVSYETNAANEVKCCCLDADTNLRYTGFYAAGTLYKTVYTDEDGKTGSEYKDKSGRVVMTRQATDHDTHYVYDDYGNLCFVLPPSAADQLTNWRTYLDDETFMKQYAYVYKYDHRNRCIRKRLPGCDWVYMVYDKADRLILTQDGNQRPRNQWTAIKYDMLGREIYTVEIVKAYDLSDIVEHYKDYVLTESFMDATAQSYPLGNTGYSNTWHDNLPMKVLTVNYYDNYDFMRLLPAKQRHSIDYRADEWYGIRHDNATGLLTGKRTYLLDGSGDYLTTAYYYDCRGRVIQERSVNYLGGYDAVYNQYDFSGNVTERFIRHTAGDYSDEIMQTYTYEYDHAGRLLETRYTLNNNPEIILSALSYDEAARLSGKNVHNASSPVTFGYDCRSWLTSIRYANGFEESIYYASNPAGMAGPHNGLISATAQKHTADTDTKGYVYNYNALNYLTDTRYMENGQVPSALYDSRANGEVFSYDRMGNITSLNRYKGTALIDDLSFCYDGNQIKSIQDMKDSQNSYSIKEYQDGKKLDVEFLYDRNGNMIQDLDRNIVDIRYNILNLPDSIGFSGGENIRHVYDASGRKWQTDNTTFYGVKLMPLMVNGSLSTRPVVLREGHGTLYAGGIDYEYEYRYDQNTGKSPLTITKTRIHNSEGYVTEGNHYYYYRKDRLGNVCEVWTPGGWLVEGRQGRLEPQPAHVAQSIRYYPSGLPQYNGSTDPSLQPYKYGGKEFVEAHGLDMYDSQARWYYPAIARTITMDPLAEKYYNLSPYAWCGNNPVNWVDPDGMYIVGTDYKPVTYDYENGWSANASEDVQLIGNAMMKTPEGKKVLDNMMGTEYGITINYKEGFHSEDRNKLGETNITMNAETKEVISAEINLFDGKIQESVSMYKEASESGHKIIPKSDRAAELLKQTPTLTERIGQVGAHEGTHATDRNAMSPIVGKEAAEDAAMAVEMKVIQQTTQYNRAIPVVVKPIF